jgi:hypothetical protein
VATEQAAARDRVLAARAELEEQIEVLEASGRAAVDIPAKIRKSPAKAAAVAGAAGFLVLKGPQRAYRAVRTAITGTPAPMPKRMLPKEIEKTLKSLGGDGDKVRGVLERDFADYAKKAEKDKKPILSVLALAVLRPAITRGARAIVESLMAPTPEGQASRLDQVRTAAQQRAEAAKRGVEQAGGSARDRVEAAGDAARDRVAKARASETNPADDTNGEPTGI